MRHRDRADLYHPEAGRRYQFFQLASIAKRHYRAARCGRLWANMAFERLSECGHLRAELEGAEDANGESPVGGEGSVHCLERGGAIREELERLLAEHHVERPVGERKGNGAALIPFDCQAFGGRH